MRTLIPSDKVFCRDYGWHNGRFYFSFGDYDDPANTGFGVLCALNDFRVKPGMGFTTHAHAEVEIVSVVLEGTLVHRDSLGFESVLRRGDCQYSCTGRGILHSEMNGSQSRDLRFLQVWFEPKESRLAPYYQPIKADAGSANGGWRHVASGDSIPGVERIAQDANVFIADVNKGKQSEFHNHIGRQCMLMSLEGQVNIDGTALFQNDALKVCGIDDLNLKTDSDAKILLIEMSEGNKA